MGEKSEIMNARDVMSILHERRFVPRPSPLPIPQAALNDAPLLFGGINQEWMAHVIGLMQVLDQPDAWEGTENEIEDAREIVRNIVLKLMEEYKPMQYPTSATFWHDQSKIVVGGSLQQSSLNNSPYAKNDGWYNTMAYQSTFARYDAFEHTFTLEAGTYNFSVLGVQHNFVGMVSWFIDDMSTPVVTNQDWYNAGLFYNLKLTSVVNVASSGLHTLRGVVTDKNVASSLYAMPLIKYWITP